MGSFERQFKKQDRSVDWTRNKDLLKFIEKGLAHVKADTMTYRISVRAVAALVQRRHPEDLEAAKIIAAMAVEVWTRGNRDEISRLLNEHIAADGANIDKVNAVARFNTILNNVGQLAVEGGATLDNSRELRVHIPLLPQEEAAARAAGAEVPDANTSLVTVIPK